MVGKRGLSGVIVTMLIIALSLVMMGVVYFVINNVVSSSSGEVQSGSSRLLALSSGDITSCKDILDGGYGDESGVYMIDPDGMGSGPVMEVYCDMETDGGGWIKIQINHTHNVLCRGDAYKYDGEDAWTYLTEGEIFEANVAGTTNEWALVDVSYYNPATGFAFNEEEISSLREIITELSSTTRMQITDADSDSYCSNAHRAKAVAEDGGEVGLQEMHTIYSNGGGGAPYYATTYWTESTREYAGHEGFAGCDSPPDVLETKYLIPKQVKLLQGSGGGVCWGYEEDYFLVR